MQTLYRLPKYYSAIIDHLVDTDREVKLLNRIFQSHGARKILDVACGIGRHAIPLAERGYDVTGVDLSPWLLAQARRDARAAKTKVRFLLRDVNTFRTRARFDAAMCMWTTLGEEPLLHDRVIQNVFRSLNPGGIFVIDNKSWEYVPKSGMARIENRTTAPNGVAIRTVMLDRFTPHYRVRDIRYTIGRRVYTDLCLTRILREEDWITCLRQAGFKRFEVYHDYRKRRLAKPHHLDIVAIK